MLHLYLTKEELQISFRRMRDKEDKIYNLILITSDYEGGHKSQLFIDKERLRDNLKKAWPGMKKACPKILSSSISFDTIDHYDNMTDIYYVPYATIKRGLTNPVVHETEYGSIPKAWETQIAIRVQDIKRGTAILKVINEVLGSLIGQFDTKRLKKLIQKFLNDPDPNASELIASLAHS